MRQEAHGCFAQMDRSLALPKARARVLLQRLQAAWREAEFLRLDQALAAPELQVGRPLGGLLRAGWGARPRCGSLRAWPRRAPPAHLISLTPTLSSPASLVSPVLEPPCPCALSPPSPNPCPELQGLARP